MNLDDIDLELIIARGRYATVNGAYKDAMQELQSLTQKACDGLRHVLQDEVNRHNHIAHVEMLVGMIASMVANADELREQKDALKILAWGKE